MKQKAKVLGNAYNMRTRWWCCDDRELLGRKGSFSHARSIYHSTLRGHGVPWSNSPYTGNSGDDHPELEREKWAQGMSTGAVYAPISFQDRLHRCL